MLPIHVELFRLLGSSVPPEGVPVKKFQEGSTKVLFLGGLLHLTGQELTRGLSSVLFGLMEDVPLGPLAIYTVTLGGKDKLFQLAEDMYDIAHGQAESGKIRGTLEAETIVNTLFLPPNIVSFWKGLSGEIQQREMNAHFEQIKLIGHSYGTSLIQQIDVLLRQLLTAEDLPLKPLEKVVAINIGPVVRPLLDGAFRQLFVFRNADKTMQAAIGRDLLSKGKSDYQIYDVGRTTCVGECCGDEMLRYAAVDKYPSGHAAPNVVFQYDHRGHGLRLYTNRPSASETAVIYPSSSLGCLLQEAAGHMFAKSGVPFSSMSSVRRLSDPDSGNIARRELRVWLETWQKRFKKLLKEYHNAEFQESMEIIQRDMVAMRVSTNRVPFSP